jgi:hypothetical protein
MITALDRVEQDMADAESLERMLTVSTRLGAELDVFELRFGEAHRTARGQLIRAWDGAATSGRPTRVTTENSST